MKALCLISGGKDSWYACHVMRHMGFCIHGVVNFYSERDDSYMLHTLNAEFVRKQAEASCLKYLAFRVSGVKEVEVNEMGLVLERIVKRDGIQALVSGAIKSDYQKHRLDMICEELGIVGYAPLWHKDEDMLLRDAVASGIRFVVVRTAAEGIENWVGAEINESNIDEFLESLKRTGVNLAGEGGEYETFVVAAPDFQRELKIVEYEIETDGKARNMILKKVKLI